MSPLNPFLVRHLAAVRVERDRLAAHEVERAVRGATDEARARSVLHPAPRLEGRGVSQDPPRRAA